MAYSIVTATFSEERRVEAETWEDAERQVWRYYTEQPNKILEGLTVRSEKDTSEVAYRRLLAKASCTIDYQAGTALH